MKTFIFVLSLFALVSQIPNIYESWRLTTIQDRLVEMVETERKALPKSLDIYTMVTDISIDDDNAVNYECVTSLYSLDAQAAGVERSLTEKFRNKIENDAEIKHLVKLGLEYRYVFRDRHGVTVFEKSLGKDDL